MTTVITRKDERGDHLTHEGRNLLLALDVLEDLAEGGSVLAVVGDDSDGAPNSLADGAVLGQLGEANPLTELLALIRHDEVHVALGAKSLDELGVFVVVAVLGQDAKTGSAAIQSLGALVEATAKTVVHQCRLKHLLQGINRAQLATGLILVR